MLWKGGKHTDDILKEFKSYTGNIRDAITYENILSCGYFR